MELNESSYRNINEDVQMDIDDEYMNSRDKTFYCNDNGSSADKCKGINNNSNQVNGYGCRKKTPYGNDGYGIDNNNETHKYSSNRFDNCEGNCEFKGVYELYSDYFDENEISSDRANDDPCNDEKNEIKWNITEMVEVLILIVTVV